VRRVAEYALILAEALDLSESRRRQIERVALFHDVGKIHEALFDIVHDDSALSDAERRAIALIRSAAPRCCAPLAASTPSWLAASSRITSVGWQGLSPWTPGSAIPLEARIVAIADTFDAVTHARRYRAGTDARTGADVIAEGRGTQFDPDLVDLFLAPEHFARVNEALVETAARGDVRKASGTQPLAPMTGRRRRTRERWVPEVSFRWRTEEAHAEPT
jgi:hypothetical protein